MRKRYSIALAGLLVLLALAGGYGYRFEYLGNFHAITPGEAYRSGELSEPRWRDVIRKNGIRSVLNLRGAYPGEAWYENEIRLCREFGVKHYDVGLRATLDPPPEKVRAIMAVFRDAPRPILIHCKAGADRSGLASAMWKVVVDGETKKEAAAQLSFFYGHLPIGETSAMDAFFERWNPE